MTTKTCEFHLQHLFLNMKRDCYFNMIKIYAESVTHDLSPSDEWRVSECDQPWATDEWRVSECDHSGVTDEW